MKPLYPKMHVSCPSPIFVYCMPKDIGSDVGVVCEGRTCRTRGRPGYQPQAIGYVFHAIVEQDENLLKATCNILQKGKIWSLRKDKEAGKWG